MLDVVSALLNHKDVDSNLKNIAGSTALDVARKCEAHGIARLLEEHAYLCLDRAEKRARTSC